MYITKSKTTYPITLDSDGTFIKRSLSIFTTETEDDSFIDLLLETSTEQVEALINQDIAYTTNTIALEDFYGGELVIKQGNFNAITSIVNNDSSTLITDYEVKKSYSQFIIEFDPTIDCDSLTINFTTGWNDIDEVPKALKQSILFKTLGIYEKTDIYDSLCKDLSEQYKII
jgi:hypothetical protein